MPLCQQKSPDPYENISEQLDRQLQSNQYLSQKLIDIINGVTGVKTSFVQNEQPKYEHSHSAYLQAINTRLDADMQAAYVKTTKCMNIVNILLDIAYGEIRLFITLLDIIVKIGEDKGIQFTQDLIRNAMILNSPECKNVLSAIKVVLTNLRALNTFLEQQQPLKDITNYSRFQKYHQLDQPEHQMYEHYFQDPQIQYILVNIYQLSYQHIDKKYNIQHFNDFTFQNSDNQTMTYEDMKAIASIPGKTDSSIGEQRIYALISIAQCLISKYHEDTIAGICIYMAHKCLVQGQNINISDEEKVGILNKNLQINLWSFFDNLSKTPVMFEMLKKTIEPDKIQSNRQRFKQCRKDELKLFLVN